MVWRLHSSIKCSLSRVFTPSPKSEPSGKHHGSTAFGFENADDKGEKEVGSLARLEVLGEVALDAIFLAAAEGRIGENDVHAVDWPYS